MATFEHAATHSGADMLGLHVFPPLIDKVEGNCLHFPLNILALDGFPLSCTAAFPTFVPAAIQIDLANP
jgi:hypothetical protein